jgi:hypothetical protein
MDGASALETFLNEVHLGLNQFKFNLKAQDLIKLYNILFWK